MKKSILCLSVFTLLASQTLMAYGPRSLEAYVAQDIQSLMDDTVNEGDQPAYVDDKSKSPAVVCKESNSSQSADRNWAFCKVRFVVSNSEDQELRTCNLLYSYNPEKIRDTLERSREDLIEACIELLSESI